MKTYQVRNSDGKLVAGNIPAAKALKIARRIKGVRESQRDVDEFTRAYIECALWSSNDESTPNGGEPMDANYSWTDLAPETLARMVADCARFQQSCRLDGYPLTNAGHDFWLTRNGHGCGFWENDFGTEAQCELLTASSKSFGECNLYVGDDGQIYY